MAECPPGPCVVFFHILLLELLSGSALSYTLLCLLPLYLFLHSFTSASWFMQLCFQDCPLLSSSGPFFQALFIPTNFFWQLQLELPVLFCELI